MSEMTQAAFARHIGQTKQYIQHLKNNGQIVFSNSGKVDVEASKRLLEQTTGSRPDVSARFAALREEKARLKEAGHSMEQIGSGLQAARAVKEKYAAMRAKVEYEILVGDLIPRDDVETALRFVGSAVRSAMDVFPDQMAPVLAPVLDMAEVHEILTSACNDVLRNVAEDIAKQKTAISKGLIK